MARRLQRRPKVGDLIETAVGQARVLRLLDANGVRLEVATRVHGDMVIERATSGWWTLVEIKTIYLPYSEVCMHMGVAGRQMKAYLTDGGGVQLLNDDGSVFSSPILRGEAAWDMQPDPRQVLAEAADLLESRGDIGAATYARTIARLGGSL